jgi:hypothetical protein
VPVEHETATAADTPKDGDHVGPPLLHLLPRHVEAEAAEQVVEILGDALLVPRRARDLDEVGGGLEETPTVDAGKELSHRIT